MILRSLLHHLFLSNKKRNVKCSRVIRIEFNLSKEQLKELQINLIRTRMLWTKVLIKIILVMNQDISTSMYKVLIMIRIKDLTKGNRRIEVEP